MIIDGDSANNAPLGRGSYANPLDTIAKRDAPTNLKMIMKLCRWYYNNDAIVRKVVQTMAEYPITDIVVEERAGNALNQYTRDDWERILNQDLNLREVMIQAGIDKKLYGISAWYLYLPFVRYCTCASCGLRTPISSFPTLKGCSTKTIETETGGRKFVLDVTARCRKCKTDQSHRTEDKRATVRNKLKLIHLNPIQMQLEYNPLTGDRRWYYEPSLRISTGLHNCDRTIVDNTELAFLQAAVGKHKMLFNNSRLFITQDEQQPGVWEGWAMPPLYPVLEDIYYYKILRRANEALAAEHVTPLRVISPAGTGDTSPQRSMNLADWSVVLKAELKKFKQDPNHLMVSPVPLSVEQIGGQARVMMVATEIEAAARVMAIGVGCPIELVWGGLNYTGASVALRVLENHFVNQRRDSERLLNFIVKKVAPYFKLPEIDASLTNFNMADDPAKQANMINLMIQGFASREAVLPQLGLDPDEEFGRMKKEHQELNAVTMQDNVAAAHMNVVIKTLESKAEVLMQYELQGLQQDLAAQDVRKQKEQVNAYSQGMKEQGYVTSLEFMQSAELISRLPEDWQGMILSNWAQTMPNVTAMLQQVVGGMGGGAGKKPKKKKEGKEEKQQAGGGNGAQSAGAAEDSGDPEAAQGPYNNGGDGTQDSGTMQDPGKEVPVYQPPGDGHSI